MLDLHSHVLPGIDDGSRNPEESLLMIGALYDQGVRILCATPHFYADETDPEHFFRRREASWNRIRGKVSEKFLKLKVYLGAEVCYYAGVSVLPDPERFCIEGTDLFLLEMPFQRWDAQTVRELEKLASNRKIHIVLAHVERCLPFQTEDTIRKIGKMGLLQQTNASAVIGLFSRRKAIDGFRSGDILFLGSDAHNMKERRPRIGEAREILIRRLGEENLRQIESRCELFFNGKK